jgi:hypothetical protein
MATMCSRAGHLMRASDEVSELLAELQLTLGEGPGPGCLCLSRAGAGLGPGGGRPAIRRRPVTA